jgi:hypothetical protein
MVFISISSSFNKLVPEPQNLGFTPVEDIQFIRGIIT